jgi:hypothetical protein
LKSAKQLIFEELGEKYENKLFDQISKISNTTTDLPGFLSAALQNVGDVDSDVYDIQKLEATLKSAVALAKQLDQAVGKALILSAGGRYDQ